MRFLFINQYYSPDYAATAQQMADLCERLAELGHDVHVLASRSLYDGRQMELAEYEVIKGVHVHRVGLSTGKRDRIRERLEGYLSFYLKAFAKAHTLPTPDIVVTLTTPPLISLLGTWLRFLRRARFVYWVMDVYPDIATRAGVLSRMGPTRGLWSLLGRITYHSANKIVVLGHDMKEAIRSKGIDSSKIEVIQSWASGEQVYPIAPEANSFRKAHSKPGDFVLMYSGNMGTCHTFDEVIAGLKEIKPEEKIRCFFVGGGKQQPRLKKYLGDNPVVGFLPYQEREDLAESLSAPDAHLITLHPKYDGLLVPSKIYGIMAAARPAIFVGSERNEIARILKEAKCGLTVQPGDMEGFAKAVRQLAAHPEEARAMGERGRKYFLEHFDQKIACRRFALMLEQEGLQKGLRGVRKLAHSTLALVPTRPGATQEAAPES